MRRGPAARANNAPAERPDARGFTLIELLVVVAIISLLLLIGMPSALVIQKHIATSASKLTLERIAAALKAYHTDFGEYPPSHYPEAEPRGAETLCRLLTGFVGDPNGDKAPPATGPDATDDGCEGFGFRLVGGGRKYGPYLGAHKLAMTEKTEPVFIDAFNQPVLYYLFNPAPDPAHTDVFCQNNPHYDSEDNDVGPEDINAYATTDGVLSREDFLLLTSGPDAEWGAPPDRGDDITNFK